MSSSHHILIGCVGKPNAGKSSFLNAATDAKAKVGNYSFTTIEPNVGVAMYPCECPCVRFNKTDRCKPKYGACVRGKRYVPVKVLDVAGLIPGASEGLGLGNKFLDDLRHADVLLHVVDSSGTTNAKGEPAEDYDPLLDVQWLREEVHSWIFMNLWKRWGNIVRRHTATSSTALFSMQQQLSGYGAKTSTIQKTLDALDLKDPCHMEEWGEAEVRRFVDAFIDARFPTVLVANKCDLKGAERNIARMCDRHGEENVVPSSALAECFLRRMKKQQYIQYEPGADDFVCSRDNPDVGLKAADEKVSHRLEHIRDLVLFRFSSTGVEDAIKRAVDLVGLIPVFPVKSLTTFSNDRSTGAFQDCVLVRPGTTMREVARMVCGEMDGQFAHVEDEHGMRMGEEDVVSSARNVFRVVKAATSTSSASTS